MLTNLAVELCILPTSPVYRLEDVSRITDRLLVLRQGQVVQDGPTDALVDDQETLAERLMAWGAAQ